MYTYLSTNKYNVIAYNEFYFKQQAYVGLQQSTNLDCPDFAKEKGNVDFIATVTMIMLDKLANSTS